MIRSTPTVSPAAQRAPAPARWLPPSPTNSGAAAAGFSRLAFYALLVGLWWLAAYREVWPPYLLPSPGSVAQFLADFVRDGTLLPALLTSAGRVLLGFAVSLLIGTALGLALARVRLLDETLGGMIVGLQSLPSICWFPLALIWFGLNEKAVLFVVVMGAVFAVTLAVRSGVRSLPPLWTRAAKVFGARGWALWRHVLLPGILPAYLAGMRQGWAFAWRSLMAAELLSQSLKVGVGHLLSTGRDLNDMAMVLGMIGVILVIGLAVDRVLFVPVELWVARRWGTEGA